MNSATETDRFWMVWNPSGRQPRYTHRSRAGADAEAKRLSASNPDQQFYVLKAVAGFVSPVAEPVAITLTTRRVDLTDDIPF